MFDGRNDDEDHDEEHDLTISIGRYTTMSSVHQHKRHASLASAHRDSIQGKRHPRPPTGSHTKKGIKRHDDRCRSSLSSRTQLYNAFVAASSQVDDNVDSRDSFHGNHHQDHFAHIEEDSYGRFIQERRDGTKHTTRSVKGLKQSKLQHRHRRQTSSRSARGSSASRSRQERSASSEREGTPTTLKKSVSFVDGGNGDAVTEVRDNDTYTDQEKEACFYTDRDFRRFRAEHYLGVVYVDHEDDSPGAAAQDLLHVVGDMWNSVLDMAFYRFADD